MWEFARFSRSSLSGISKSPDLLPSHVIHITCMRIPTSISYLPQLCSYAVLPSAILSCTFRKYPQHSVAPFLGDIHWEPSLLLFHLLIKQLFLRSRWFVNDEECLYRESNVAFDTLWETAGNCLRWLFLVFGGKNPLTRCRFCRIFSFRIVTVYPKKKKIHHARWAFWW